ncbi:unnamed protein product [Cochlearia groenlandica]
MDSIDFENVKAEKAKALHRYNSFRTIGLLFRTAEIVVAILFLCWLFTCLPFAVRISGEFLRRLSSLVSTPLFMFFLGNTIIVALLTTKSTVFSAAGKTIAGGNDGGEETDIYEAFISSGETRVSEDIVYDDKQMISAAETALNPDPTAAREDHAIVESVKDSNFITDTANDDHPPPKKAYRRSKSEICSKQSLEIVSKPLLRRSETEKCRRIVGEVSIPEDNMSNEEFQRTIEAFIAKQLIFRRRESLAVVIHNKI